MGVGIIEPYGSSYYCTCLLLTASAKDSWGFSDTEPCRSYCACKVNTAVQKHTKYLCYVQQPLPCWNKASSVVIRQRREEPGIVFVSCASQTQQSRPRKSCCLQLSLTLKSVKKFLLKTVPCSDSCGPSRGICRVKEIASGGGVRTTTHALQDNTAVNPEVRASCA